MEFRNDDVTDAEELTDGEALRLALVLLVNDSTTPELRLEDAEGLTDTLLLTDALDD